MGGAITGLYAGLMGLFLVVLSVRAVAGRVKHKVEIGDAGNPDLQLRVRAFGNFIEYVPLALVLMVLLELHGFSAWVVHALGIMLLAARLAHAYGLSHSPGITSPGRFAGINLTWLVVALGAVLNILHFFGVRF